jgi:hypothetical protein
MKISSTIHTQPQYARYGKVRESTMQLTYLPLLQALYVISECFIVSAEL